MAKSLHGKATVDGIDGTVTYTAIASAGALDGRAGTAQPGWISK
jgi:hypothetical protein